MLKKYLLSFYLFFIVSLFFLSCKNLNNRNEFEPSLTDLTITLPDVNYSIGEQLNVEGLVVKAIYSDKSEKDITDKISIYPEVVPFSERGKYT